VESSPVQEEYRILELSLPPFTLSF